MNFDRMIFGYKKIRINRKDIVRVADRLIKNGLSAKFDGEIMRIPIVKAKKYVLLLAGIEFEDLGDFGLLGFLQKNRKRYGAFAGIVIAMMICFLSAERIYDVRVSGNEEMSSEEVISELSAAGLSVGKSFRTLSLNKVESAVLGSSDSIGWLNINRRGNVAYVQIKEKRVYQIENELGYSNVVASCDCIIESITVRQGSAMVRNGEVVKKGQLLISGVLPDELGGGFVNADGEVRGRVSDIKTVEVARSEEMKKIVSDEKSALKVKIFDFSINIFKKYRNYREGYVIIKDNKRLELFGKYLLPVFIITERALTYEKVTVEHTDAELAKLARDLLAQEREKLSSSGCELLKLTTESSVTNECYRLTDRMTYVCDVGEEKYFSN